MKAVPSVDPDAARFSFVQIQTQSRCNADCLMCPYGSVSRRLPQGRMSRELFVKVADDVLARDDVRHVSLMLQNEPLLDDRLPEMARYLRERRDDVRLSIATNGALLTPPMAARLAAAGLTDLTFSLNALTPESFAAIERRLDFDRVLANLEALIAAPPPGVALTLKLLVMRSNAVEIMGGPRFSDLLQRARAAGLRCSIEPISNRAGSLESYDREVMYAGGQSSYHKTHCLDVFDHLNVLFNGDVIACCADWERASTYGSVVTAAVEEVWSSDAARERRRGVLAGEYAALRPCASCSQAHNIVRAARHGPPR